MHIKNAKGKKAMQQSIFWCCPNCNTILKKPSHSNIIAEFMEGGSHLEGRVTCVTCQGTLSPSDVYGGKYDVEKNTNERGEPVYIDVNGKYYIDKSGRHWGRHN